MAADTVGAAAESAAARVLAEFEQARASGRRLLARGSGLRIGSAAADWRVVSMRETAGVRRHHPEDLTVEVGAGTTLLELDRYLEPFGQWFPVGIPDGGDDTVGGVVGAGLLGVESGYGPVRDRLLGLVAVTPAFGVVRLGASVVKSVAGYNMPRLFWGSRGAFGVILAVTLKLAPRPRAPMRTAIRPVDLNDWPTWHPPVIGVLDAGWPEATAVVRTEDGTATLHLKAAEDALDALGFSSDLVPDGWPTLRGRIRAQGRLRDEEMPTVLEHWRRKGVEGVVDLRSAVFSMTAHAGLDEVLGTYAPQTRRLGDPPGVLSVPPALYPPLARFKASVDPEGLLMPLVAAGGGT